MNLVASAPGPYVQAHLDALGYRKTRMPCLLPTSASTVRPKVLPVDRVASNGLEDNSLDGSGIMSLAAIANDILVAFNEATPPLIEAQSSQQRELRAAANKLTIVASGCINPGHEATHPAPSSPG